MKTKILLRKLTKNSIIQGACTKFMEGSHVDKLLKEDPWRLAFIYYRTEKLSFTDDILEELGIKGKYEIKKPGVDKNKQKEFFRDYLSTKPEKEYMELLNRKIKRYRHMSLNYLSSDNKLYSPKNMQSRNQGHGVSFFKKSIKI